MVIPVANSKWILFEKKKYICMYVYLYSCMYVYLCLCIYESVWLPYVKFALKTLGLYYVLSSDASLCLCVLMYGWVSRC